MVWGHSGAPFTHFVYLFHMAIFFIASGYCWNDRNIQNAKLVRKYIVKKIRTLYLPFVLCNSAFVLLNHVLVSTHLYSQSSFMTWKEIGIEILKILTFGGSAGLAGATWFIRTLFFVSVGNAVMMYLIKKLKFEKYGPWILFVLCGVVAQIISQFSITLPKGLHNCFAAYFVFFIGVFIRKYKTYKSTIYIRIVLAAVSFLILCVLDQFGGVSVGSGSFPNLAYYAAASIFGWLLLWNVSELLPKKLSKCIASLGKNTLQVVLFHFLAFKIVSLAYILFTHSDIDLLSCFPVIETVPYLWIPYLFVGVSVPWILGILWKNTKTKLRRFERSR